MSCDFSSLDTFEEWQMGAELSTEEVRNSDLEGFRDKLSMPSSPGLGGNGKMSHQEVPEDISGFFGHPLMMGAVAAGCVSGGGTSPADDEDAESHASALALLHEYQNLPAIDRDDDMNDGLDKMLSAAGASDDVNNNLDAFDEDTRISDLFQEDEVDAFLNQQVEEVRARDMASKGSSCSEAESSPRGQVVPGSAQSLRRSTSYTSRRSSSESDPYAFPDDPCELPKQPPTPEAWESSPSPVKHTGKPRGRPGRGRPRRGPRSAPSNAKQQLVPDNKSAMKSTAKSSGSNLPMVPSHPRQILKHATPTPSVIQSPTITQSHPPPMAQLTPPKWPNQSHSPQLSRSSNAPVTSHNPSLSSHNHDAHMMAVSQPTVISISRNTDSHKVHINQGYTHEAQMSQAQMASGQMHQSQISQSFVEQQVHSSQGQMSQHQISQVHASQSAQIHKSQPQNDQVQSYSGTDQHCHGQMQLPQNQQQENIPTSVPTNNAHQPTSGAHHQVISISQQSAPVSHQPSSLSQLSSTVSQQLPAVSQSQKEVITPIAAPSDSVITFALQGNPPTSVICFTPDGPISLPYPFPPGMPVPPQLLAFLPGLNLPKDDKPVEDKEKEQRNEGQNQEPLSQPTNLSRTASLSQASNPLMPDAVHVVCTNGVYVPINRLGKKDTPIKKTPKRAQKQSGKSPGQTTSKSDSIKSPSTMKASDAMSPLSLPATPSSLGSSSLPPTPNPMTPSYPASMPSSPAQSPLPSPATLLSSRGSGSIPASPLPPASSWYPPASSSTTTQASLPTLAEPQTQPAPVNVTLPSLTSLAPSPAPRQSPHNFHLPPLRSGAASTCLDLSSTTEQKYSQAPISHFHSQPPASLMVPATTTVAQHHPPPAYSGPHNMSQNEGQNIGQSIGQNGGQNIMHRMENIGQNIVQNSRQAMEHLTQNTGQNIGQNARQHVSQNVSQQNGSQIMSLNMGQNMVQSSMGQNASHSTQMTQLQYLVGQQQSMAQQGMGQPGGCRPQPPQYLSLNESQEQVKMEPPSPNHAESTNRIIQVLQDKLTNPGHSLEERERLFTELKEIIAQTLGTSTNTGGSNFQSAPTTPQDPPTEGALQKYPGEVNRSLSMPAPSTLSAADTTAMASPAHSGQVVSTPMTPQTPQANSMTPETAQAPVILSVQSLANEVQMSQSLSSQPIKSEYSGVMSDPMSYVNTSSSYTTTAAASAMIQDPGWVGLGSDLLLPQPSPMDWEASTPSNQTISQTFVDELPPKSTSRCEDQNSRCSPDSAAASRLLVIRPSGMSGTSPPPYMPLYNSGDLKSPDSGFNETQCPSPAAETLAPVVAPSAVFDRPPPPAAGAVRPGKLPLPLQPPASGDQAGSKQTITKRRTPGAGSGHTTPKSPLSNLVYTIPKIDPELCLFHYFLDTPTSTSQKIHEDRITYLNKGQFYNLVLKHKTPGILPLKTRFKSVIVVTFREEKSTFDQLKAWEFWHSRQHTEKQRILDIDTKNTEGIATCDISEIAYNAVSVLWNPRESSTTISLSINCLSTDFSNQKGVKGLPLHVQVDTFEEECDSVLHRGYCQVKIFCDKGAERKARDEERRKEAKSKAAAEMQGSRRRLEEVYHPACDTSAFYHMADLSKPPAFFVPTPETDETTPSSSDMTSYRPPQVMTGVDSSTDALLPRKRFRSNSYTKKDSQVLLYVREEQEMVFTALLLASANLHSLLKAVEEKYNIPIENVQNVFKKSRKGILVRMDDNIIAHYSNEATFIITLTQHNTPAAALYDITLTELDEDVMS